MHRQAAAFQSIDFIKFRRKYPDADQCRQGHSTIAASAYAVPKHVRLTYPKVSVQGTDLRYFIVVEIKQVAFQVLGESPDVVAFGNNSNPALRCPPEEYLCWGCEGINIPLAIMGICAKPTFAVLLTDTLDDV